MNPKPVSRRTFLLETLGTPVYWWNMVSDTSDRCPYCGMELGEDRSSHFLRFASGDTLVETCQESLVRFLLSNIPSATV